jgi:hypothetical protein
MSCNYLFICTDTYILIFILYQFNSLYRDHYFTSVSWLDDETVSITWMNRVQNVSTVSKCQAPAYYCGEVRKKVMFS